MLFHVKPSIKLLAEYQHTHLSDLCYLDLNLRDMCLKHVPNLDIVMYEEKKVATLKENRKLLFFLRDSSYHFTNWRYPSFHLSVWSALGVS